MPTQGGHSLILCPTLFIKGYDMNKLARLAISTALLLSGCAPVNQSEVVTLVAHDSFAISDESVADFEENSGFKLEILRAGDTGSLTNRLVLTKNSPIGDVVFGIDSTFRGVADENDLIEGTLSEVTYSDVCFNYDRVWFETNKVTPPASWRDLVKPTYRDLTVVTNPLTSSPGLAFLASTVAAFGENGFEDFWQQLKDNGVQVAAGWEEAYFTEFSGSSGKGVFPIVLSYSSSPAAEVRDDGKSQTVALLEDCFRQVEYVGVLAGSKNPTGAKALVEYLLAEPFQSTMPGLMYVYPVNPEASVPAEWAEFGPAARSNIGQDLAIAPNRDTWQDKWSAIFG
jgi:thiamine transport system substrate-binding protein